jgi:AAA family ATP:ADP antiporter
MVNGPPAKVLGRIVKIKPGEMKLAVLIFAYFFLIAAPYTIINALRTSNFLFKEGVGWLPVVYLLAVIATGLVVILHSRIRVRRSIRTLIVPSLLFFAVSGLLLQWVLQTDYGRRSVFLTYFYWVWASVLIIVLITGFWMTVNEVYNPRQAKRLIVFLNSGGLLGSVLGGLLVMFLSEGALDAFLLPLACAMLFGCVGIVNAIFRLHESRPRPAGEAAKERLEKRASGILESLGAVRKDRFLVLIAAIVAIGIIVSTCIEFQFLSAAYGRYGSRETLQAFFGFFEAALTVFAFALNFLMAGYLLRKLTAPRTLLLTPAALLAGSVALLLTPFGLLSGIFIRGLDEGLAFSVNHPFREIMYIPIPAHLRHKAKAFIEMFVSQFAKVAGAVVLLAFAFLLNKKVEGFTPRFDPQLARYLSWVVIAFLIPWILIGLKVGKEYLAALKENIQPLWDPAELSLSRKVDVEYAKLVFDTVDSQSYSSVLYALHLFDLLAQNRLSPDLKKVIAAKAEEVRAKAFSDRLEAGAAALFPEALDDLPVDVIRTEVPIILSSDAYQRVMRSYADKILEQGPGAEVEKMELAKAIGLMRPDSPLAGYLTRLIGDDSPAVTGFALKSAARLKKDEDIPAIVGKLGASANFEDAVEALRGYGDRAVPSLERRLLDRSAAIGERMAVADVLGRIGTRRAVRSLTEELEYGRGELDKGVIDVLDRLRTEHGDIPLSVAAARRKTYALIEKFCRDFIDLQEKGMGSDEVTTKPGLAKGLEVTFGNIFKLLGLYYPQEDIRRAYQNIRTGTRNSVAHAVEWLDNALDKDLHDVILPLVDDLGVQEKTAKFRRILQDLGDPERDRRA